MKPRGIIIVDASSLQHLLTPVRNELLFKGTSTAHDFTELLNTLAAAGYQILIPEMVAYEAARILPDGRSRNEVLGLSDQTHADDPVIQHMRYAESYFKKQIAEHDPHITIAVPPEDSHCEAAALMRKLKWAADKPDQQVFYSTDLKIRSKHHLGDMAAIDLTRTLDNPHSLPVFYLCDDNNARKDLNDAANPEVNLLNVEGLLEAMHAEHILNHWPLGETVTVKDIIHEMQNAQAVRNAAKGGKRWITPVEDCMDRTDYHLKENDHPFRSSLIGAQAELYPAEVDVEPHHGKLMRSPPVKKTAPWTDKHPRDRKPPGGGPGGAL
jgi:hypothetical protein